MHPRDAKGCLAGWPSASTAACTPHCEPHCALRLPFVVSYTPRMLAACLRRPVCLSLATSPHPTFARAFSSARGEACVVGEPWLGEPPVLPLPVSWPLPKPPRALELLPVLSFARLTPQLRRQSDHTLGREE